MSAAVLPLPRKQPPVSIDVHPKALFLYRPKRYKVCIGGRGSMKSTSIANALISDAYRGHRNPITGKLEPHLILCCRETQKSIQESVHSIISKRIEKNGLSRYFKVTDYEITCTRNGSRFIFEGLRIDPDKIKSIEGITRCWVSEAAHISKASWQILVPTVREPGSEIWVDLNPDEEDDETWQRFVVHPPPESECEVVWFNWRDNPWLSDELRKEKDWDFKVDPVSAGVIWDGDLRRNPLAQIMRDKWVVEEFEADEGPFSTWDGPYHGLDFGFSQSPLFGTRNWVHNNDLWVDWEVYGREVANDDIARKLREVPSGSDSLWRCDAARPETINHLQQHGIRAEGAPKWPGSVEDGIQFLRSFGTIHIHPRCVHLVQQYKDYSYKTDRITGEVLNKIVKKHDDGPDSQRYALAPMIQSNASIYETLASLNRGE